MLNYININKFFTTFSFNRISSLIELEIYINLPLFKEIVRLLPYIILKEELDKISKEETIKILNKNKT